MARSPGVPAAPPERPLGCLPESIAPTAGQGIRFEIRS